MSSYYSVPHPLREALCFLVKDAKSIPDFVSGQYKREHFTNEEDAAMLIVARAVENANVEVEADV